MIYGYLRVSTQQQTLENQKFEIEEYLKSINKSVSDIKWIEEKRSGTIDYKERSLGKLLKKLKEGDTLICTEISRLGRNMLMIMEILNHLISKKVALISIKERLIFDNTISAKVISFAFSLSAEIERNLISQRTKEALELRKAQGIKLGRPAGSKNKAYKLDKYEGKIRRLLGENKSLYFIAKSCGRCNFNTLKNYLKYKNILWFFGNSMLKLDIFNLLN